jgi:large subunit ribosomal protein L1
MPKEKKEVKAPAKKTSKKKEVKVEVKKKKEVVLLFDNTKTYNIADAIGLIKKSHKAKFDATVEAHFRLGIDNKKGEQQVRGAVSLPHGTGKSVKVAAFVSPANEKAVKEAGADLVGGEELIAEIKKTEKTDFQVAVAEPDMMKNLAQIAKILGTRGLMPSPKNDTVSPNPAKMVAELKKGKISFKNDNTGNIHTVIGKISFDDTKLVENFNVLLETIKKSKPSSTKGVYIKNVSLNSTMGPGIKISVS